MITIKNKRFAAELFDEPQAVETPVKAVPPPDNSALIEILKQHIDALSKSNEPRKPIDVVATIVRDKEGKMTSVVIMDAHG